MIAPAVSHPTPWASSRTGDTDEFFGIVDTNNPDTSGRDVVATWVFDIGAASNLSLSIDMGAMGDFEASPTTGDFFNWSYSIDGGAAQTILPEQRR